MHFKVFQNDSGEKKNISAIKSKVWDLDLNTLYFTCLPLINFLNIL